MGAETPKDLQILDKKSKKVNKTIMKSILNLSFVVDIILYMYVCVALVNKVNTQNMSYVRCYSN